MKVMTMMMTQKERSKMVRMVRVRIKKSKADKKSNQTPKPLPGSLHNNCMSTLQKSWHPSESVNLLPM